LGGQILEDHDHGSDVELGILGAQKSDFSDGKVEFLTLDELDKRVEIVLIFEALVVLHDEGVVETSQQILFLGNVLEQRVFFYLLLAVGLEHIELLLLELIEASHQQDGAELAFLQFLKHDKLVEAIDKFVSFLDLLVELLSLSLFIFLDHSVHEPTDDFLDDIGFDFRDDSVGFHHDIIFVAGFGLVLEQELLAVDLRSHCDRIDVFVFLQGPLDDDDDLLIVYILCVFLDDHIASLVAVDLHEVQDLFYLFFGEFGEMGAFLDGPFHEVPEGDDKDLVS
jgi:hypothetical protein